MVLRCRAAVPPTLLQVIREVAATVVLVEHDEEMFSALDDDKRLLIEQIGQALHDLTERSSGLVVLSARRFDKSVTTIARYADCVVVLRGSARRGRVRLSQGTGRPASPADAGRGLVMGRVFVSPRMGGQRSGVLMREQDRVAADCLGAMAKRYASEGFYTFDDPLEAAVVSALVTLVCPERGR